MSKFANIALLTGGGRVRTWIREQTGPVEAVRPVWFWPDHFFTQPLMANLDNNPAGSSVVSI